MGGGVPSRSPKVALLSVWLQGGTRATLPCLSPSERACLCLLAWLLLLLGSQAGPRGPGNAAEC